ncbi:hypothetical protein C1H46_020427 [Malus baccata]|uniref:Uncharacterized protein n=1 Tax=Malus baccata TaxID=106549 RepID=A0A540M651_MALBA|nr:hypothetical protein C1H46_020427 [Malus baccata]
MAEIVASGSCLSPQGTNITDQMGRGTVGIDDDRSQLSSLSIMEDDDRSRCRRKGLVGRRK